MRAVRLLCPFVLVLSLAWASVSAATPVPSGVSTVPLAVVTNDRDNNVSRLELMIGNDTVRGLYLRSTHQGADDQEVTSGRVYTLPEIESRDGVVLGQGQGEKAIFLQGNIVAQNGLGSLTVRYLSNGLFHHYNECRIDLRRIAPGDWQLVNAYDGKPVRYIRVQTWALGISTIANVCPGATLS